MLQLNNNYYDYYGDYSGEGMKELSFKIKEKRLLGN
jgi:hypothetical protein